MSKGAWKNFGAMAMRVAVLMLIIIVLRLMAGSPSDPATPISHVIVIMQENHSFDNYFGTYPTANGTVVNSITSALQPVDGIPNGICLPDGNGCLTPYYANSSSTLNPIEGQSTYENDYDGGRMDGFARYSGVQSLAWFDYSQIAAYWIYAEEYGVGENYFAPLLTTTNPNRLMLLAGDTVVSQNYGPPPYMPYNETILHQLSSNGISWGYYDFLNRSQVLVPPLSYLSGLNSTTRQQTRDISALFQELNENHGLPAVSFVSAIGSDGLDEHPPSNVTEGELWVVSIVNAVMESKYWNSSVVFITYDEGGGYYDHVPPPQDLTIDGQFSEPLYGYGQRVPLLVISPYAKENYVSTTLLSHMSLLRFIDDNWKLPPLNPNVLRSNDLTDFFYFGSEPRGPIILSPNGQYSWNLYPAPIQIPFNDLPYPRSNSSIPQQNLAQPLIPTFVLAGIAAIVILSFGVMSVRRRRRLSRSSAVRLTPSQVSQPISAV